MSERAIEVPWAIANTHTLGAPVLDVGCAESTYLGQLAQPVDGIDTRVCTSSQLRSFYRGDIRTFEAPELYPTVLAISTLEHIGLATYDNPADDPEHGDRVALEGCFRATQIGGRLLVSVPYGAPKDYGWFRQYNYETLSEFLSGYTYELEVCASENGTDWGQVDPQDAEVQTREYLLSRYSAAAVALIAISKAPL